MQGDVMAFDGWRLDAYEFLNLMTKNHGKLKTTVLSNTVKHNEILFFERGLET
jgi:hypothetical protein